MTMMRNIKRGISSITSVPIVVAIIIVINLLAVAFYVRADMTESKIYSLSDASKRIAANLDDPVVVKLYFTEELPAPYNQHARYLKDQLYEYQNYSGGLLRFEFIDPVKEERESEARNMGIPAVQVNAVEKDKIELKKVYMGVAFLFEDKREVIPVVQSVDNLEYEISSALLKITSDELPMVGILQGHGEPVVGEDISVGLQVLQQLYRVRPVTIQPGQLIADDLSTLLIIGPTDSLSVWDQYAIDQFIMRGGKLAVFYDPVTVDVQVQQATTLQNNWREFLAHYGIGFQDGLVLDMRNSRIAVMQQQGAIRFQNIVEYPFLPQVYNFNDENMIGKDLEAVNLPFAAAIDTTIADSLGYDLEPICWSSGQSGIRRPPYYLSPMQEFSQADFDQPFQVLAAVIYGSFESAFSAGMPDFGDAGIDVSSLAPAMTEGDPNRLVVVGDAEFCNDNQLQRNPSNAAMFLNVVDWLTQEEGLISIRSREVISRPLEEISDGKRQAVKYANIFGPPILVILFGLIRWQAQRRRKR
ncbi:MAG: Gldg family protein [Candidatus Zixiibacteriota bacterium]